MKRQSPSPNKMKGATAFEDDEDDAQEVKMGE